MIEEPGKSARLFREGMHFAPPPVEDSVVARPRAGKTSGSLLLVILSVAASLEAAIKAESQLRSQGYDQRIDGLYPLSFARLPQDGVRSLLPIAGLGLSLFLRQQGKTKSNNLLEEFDLRPLLAESI